MGIFDFFSSNEESNKKDERLEKEMEEMGLDEWEKEEVRNGNYDLDNFEEEDLEEDDYYYEDD